MGNREIDRAARETQRTDYVALTDRLRSRHWGAFRIGYRQ
jgi:hypothetical protein